MFSAREIPCDFRSAHAPDFSAAPVLQFAGVCKGRTGGFVKAMLPTLEPPGLSSRQQSLNEHHQRAVDLFTDALKTILQPFKGRPSLPFWFSSLDQRVKLVVSGNGPVIR